MMVRSAASSPEGRGGAGRVLGTLLVRVGRGGAAVTEHRLEPGRTQPAELPGLGPGPVEDGDLEVLDRDHAVVGLSALVIEEMYQTMAIANYEDRFVIPPMHREYAVELMGDPYTFKAETGVGFHKKPERGL